MWGIFIGILIGVLQVLVLTKLGGMIMGDGKSVFKLLGALLLLIKVAAIVLVLYLLSTVSLAHVIWAAGGMLIGLVAASTILITRRKKTNGEDEHGD